MQRFWQRLLSLFLRNPAPPSAPPAPSAPPDSRFLLRLLDDRNVRFVVIGGVALRLHGVDHTPHDVDVFIANDPANLEAIAQAAKAQGVRLIRNARVLIESTHLTMETESGNMDLLAKIRGVDFFQGVWDRSILREIDGREVHVASLDDLIAMKRVANRPKDREHVVLMQALQRQQE